MILVLTVLMASAISQPAFVADEDLSYSQTQNKMGVEENSEGEIRILPVGRTPESNTVVLKVSVPRTNQVLKKNPVWIQFRLDGYSLGSGSQFERAAEVVNTKMGQTVHVVVDNQPYFMVNEPALDPFDESGYYYDTSYKFEVPFKLQEGMHTIRVFPARSYGESLKGDKTFFATHFYIGEEKDRPEMALSSPYITYNEPSEQMRLVEGKPVLLDFYLTNCALTADGYKVRLTVDGKMHRTLTSWQPYYIYGLKKGRHQIRLELIDRTGKQVPGLFNDTERSIQVH